MPRGIPTGQKPPLRQDRSSKEEAAKAGFPLLIRKILDGNSEPPRHILYSFQGMTPTASRPYSHSMIARFAFAAVLALMSLAVSAAERPNIVFIFSDDQGMNDVGCYGSEIPTPNIDSIARNGLKMDSFYVAAPVCTPSRFGLMTGRYPNRSHDNLRHALMFLDRKDSVIGIRKDEMTIAEVLKKRGYQTALIGKWHLGHGKQEFLPNAHGFDYSYGTTGGCVDYFTLKYGDKPDWARDGKQIEEKGYSTDLITGEAVKFLEAQKRGKPFYLYLAYTAPHYGKGWNEKTRKLSNILQAKDSDRAKLANIEDKDRREFAGMVAALDEGVGRVLETLKRMKLDEKTLVVFACDNGGDPHYGGSNKPFRGQKNQVFEGGIRVPCVMQWPGKIKPGTTTQEPVTALDFFPTFCELAGASTRKHQLDGQSILKLMTQNRAPAERDLFWKTLTGDALRRGPWKYVRVGADEMLFNLEDDPHEQEDLARVKPDLLAELKEAHQKISATLQTTADKQSK